ncbi:MAG: hypothetical protein AAFR77_16940 [Cyanobacteria bacterium J06631_2]
MSTIVNATDPLFAVENAAGGLDIQGFEDQVNRLNGSDENDLIIGGGEDDILSGLGGNDTIEGLAGNDIISGGASVDTLIGGEGADTFVFDVANIGSGEIDQILDFDPSEDSLGIIGLEQGDNVDYDRSTGILSLNGQAFAQIGIELPLGDNQLDFDDLIFDGSGIFGAIEGSDDGMDDGMDDGIDDGMDDGTDGGAFVGTEGVDDVFAFDRDTALDAGEIIPIEGFEPGVDTLQINGIVSGDSIGLDRSTGIIRINGQPFAQIDPDAAQGINKNRDFDLL